MHLYSLGQFLFNMYAMIHWKVKLNHWWLFNMEYTMYILSCWVCVSVLSNWWMNYLYVFQSLFYHLTDATCPHQYHLLITKSLLRPTEAFILPTSFAAPAAEIPLNCISWFYQLAISLRKQRTWWPPVLRKIINSQPAAKVTACNRTK